MAESLFTVWLVVFAIDLARYVVVAGAAFAVLWVALHARWGRRFLGRRPVAAAHLARDLGWSLSTVLVFSVVGVLVKIGGERGVLRRYEHVADDGLAWLVGSVVVLVVLQDAYFYFTHRALHHPWLFRRVHHVHHASSTTSPWTAYAFSPLEALVHALFVPLAWVVLPLCDEAVFAFLGFMIVRNVLGHSSVELYPKGFARSRFWGLHTTTTHHALHHRRSRVCFGLYFTFWDRWLGTAAPDYEDIFERHAQP